MGRKAAALIAYMLVLLSSLSAISADDFGTFFTSIINASYHNDFAYGLFPISFWGEFGLNDMELIKGHESKVYSRVEAGFSQRRLRQDPVTGDIIEDYGRLMVKDGQYASSEYSVVFSDGSVGYQQSLVRNPDPSRGDMLSISISLGMRWEQAFASFYDIRMGNYGGVFNSLFFKPDGYDSAKASSTPGTPDLAGNLYFLTNKLELGIAFFDRDTDYLTPSGYYAEIDIEAAPWWLANSLDIFDIRTDYLRLGLSGSYDYTILSQKQKDGFNLYSLVLNTRINAQFLIGQAIPRHAMKVSYRGKDIPQRTMIMDIYASLA
ncbi:MAG: hypothetical protein SPJ34_00825, partial [Candidatus Ornithospirochaeta sp.]|nr:hypothetical protein [Candidatus Ornithospirochaeta sp.]